MLTSIRPPDERSRGLHPCASLDDLRRQHTERRKSLAEAAASVDARIAALGTCPLAGETSTTEDSRYHRLIERFGSVTGAEQFTCGQHVHISVASDEEAVAAIDRLQQWLPVVRALSANSPFWHEHDTDYASYRSVLWHRWPTAGPTQPFGSIANYRDTVAALCRALVEESVRSWRAGEPAPSIRAEYLQAAGWAAARFGLSDRLFALPTAEPVRAMDAVDQLVAFVRPALERFGDAGLVDAEVDRLRAQGTGAAEQRAHVRAGADMPALTAWACERTTA
jgi:glutamate---cysteine ligase / carboxylate-amine ligase